MKPSEKKALSKSRPPAVPGDDSVVSRPVRVNGDPTTAPSEPWDAAERAQDRPQSSRPAPASAVPADKANDKTSTKSASPPSEPVAGHVFTLDQVPDVADVLPQLCERYRTVHESVVALEKEKKELSAQILPLMDAVEAKSITAPTWVAVKSKGTNVSISKEKLLANGVGMDIIEKSTQRTPYYYVQVRKPGESA